MENKSCLSGILNVKGFTLIELLVVVLIIGILAAVALLKYQVAVTKARIARLLPLLKTLQDARRVYYLSNGHYSLTFGELDVDIPTPNSITAAGSGSWTSGERAYYDDYLLEVLTSNMVNMQTKRIDIRFALDDSALPDCASKRAAAVYTSDTHAQAVVRALGGTEYLRSDHIYYCLP